MIDYSNVPDELKQLKQWVNADKDSKVPMRSYECRAASASDCTTWSSFTESFQAYESGIYDYCGFVFADNGLIGIDIDTGFDELGLITPLAADIIGHCESYTEKSRSGRGFHILLRGNLPIAGKNNLSGVEIYKSARYFILTGDILEGHDTIRENQSAIDYVYETYFKPSIKENERISDSEVIYRPIWSTPIKDGKIHLRPTYPKITKGSRNLCLTSLAGKLHSLGYSKEQIFNELLYANKTACTPMLDQYEIRTICNSVTRYKY